MYHVLMFGLLMTPKVALALDIDNHLQQLIQSADLRQTKVAFMVKDLQTSEILAELNADVPMIPASNMKLITTAAALDVLGTDFVFRTKLSLIQTDQVSPNGITAETRLGILGGGDPAFGDPVLLGQHGLIVDDLLNQWVQAVAQTQVSRFKGLLVDDRIFDSEFVHPSWPTSDLIKHYGAQVTGLNFHTNCVDVLPEPTVQGQTPRIRLFPDHSFLQTVNRAETSDQDLFTIDRKLGTNELIFGGTVRNRRNAPYRITIHDPPMLFARWFAQRLADRGIEIGSLARASEQEQLHEIKTLHLVQTTLPQILKRTNQDSQNLFAECLLKRMGREMTGRPGSWKGGAAAIRIVLAKRLGSPSATIAIDDGSGLSRGNRATARIFLELLDSMHQDTRKSKIFRESLAAGGAKGTLRRRFGDLEGQVYAKSGYLRSVSALSGYLVLPAESVQIRSRTIGFSFLFNGFAPHKRNFDIKKLQEKMLKRIEQALIDPVTMGG